MPKPSSRLTLSELRGLILLADAAVAGGSDIAEGVHRKVWDTLGAPPGKEAGRTRGVTGLAYQSVRGISRLLAQGANHLLQALEGQPDTSAASPRRTRLLAVLNGIVGDRLAAEANPLATRMALYRAPDEEAEALPAAAGKLLLLIHGLCMSEYAWQGAGEETVDYAVVLAGIGYAPLYLRYNSGRHVSHNGRELAALLEKALADRPGLALSVVAHSMGGLVLRSACHYARQAGMRWPERLQHMVFLGTPHHGAPLEQAGNYLEAVLGKVPHAAPWASLARVRSAGITDLREGRLLDEDWQGWARFHRHRDTHAVLPLPEGVACFAVAAVVTAKPGALADRLLGDGLVPLQRALGQHHDPARALRFAPHRQQVCYGMHHMQLLSSPEVGRQLLAWLAAP